MHFALSDEICVHVAKVARPVDLAATMYAGYEAQYSRTKCVSVPLFPVSASLVT